MEEKQNEISIKITALCCAVFATVLYLNTLSADFVYDDKLVKIDHNFKSIILISVGEIFLLQAANVLTWSFLGRKLSALNRSREHSCKRQFLFECRNWLCKIFLVLLHRHFQNI